jgi:ketosteroid isomerase-like protein
MSQENVETLRRAIEAFNRGDTDAWAAVRAPEFEYSASGAVVGIGGSYRGADGFKQFLDSFWDEFDEPKVELGEVIAGGAKVLAAVTFRGRGKHSGIDTSWDLWQLWTLRGGRAVRGQAFTDKEAALEAAGLWE